MLLRVYTLVQPLQIPIEQAYIGCKSWIQLEIAVPEDAAMTPVLDEEAFNAQVAEMKRTLA